MAGRSAGWWRLGWCGRARGGWRWPGSAGEFSRVLPWWGALCVEESGWTGGSSEGVAEEG